jgi:hypothetical protein
VVVDYQDPYGYGLFLSNFSPILSLPYRFRVSPKA